MGGGAGGTNFVPQPNPQALQALLAQRALMGGGAGAAPGGAPGAPAAPAGAVGASPAAAATPNPVAQQLAARGAVPGGGGVPVMQPRPGMGWGAAPGGGPMGAPPAGGTAMAGAGAAPGVPPGAIPGQQQALMGALAGRGTAAPGAGMPTAAPVNPQALAVNPQALAALPGAGFAKGGHIVPQKGTSGPIKRSSNRIVPEQGTSGPIKRSSESIVPQKGTTGPIGRSPGRSFDSTKAVPGNLATHAGGRKFAEGGSCDFDSTKGAPGNLPTHAAGKKMARGGVVKRGPKAKTEDRKSPPVPTYDTPQAGTDGWPPTPNFTPGAAAANTPMPGMKKGGKWIQNAIKKPGALHRQLGVPQGEKIPAKKLAKAAGAGGKLGERARLAEKLKGFNKAKGGECDDKKMRKGGSCDKMAAGGAAKQRRGFPNTIPPPKRMATGGGVRGCGAATKGCKFSGIY